MKKWKKLKIKTRNNKTISCSISYQIIFDSNLFYNGTPFSISKTNKNLFNHFTRAPRAFPWILQAKF
jgi:hypothetical protein